MQAITALTAAITLVAPALAQDLGIPWFTIDSGGGTLSAGPYTLSGTIGQHDVHAPLVAGPYTLTGGFWAGVNPTDERCNAADLAPPYGLLDLGDINAFVSGFITSDAVADLDGNGLLDLRDINIFIAAFVGGCP